MLFYDFSLLFELQNGSKIIKNRSRNALWFLTSFRNRFSSISAQFSRSPNLKNRAPVYTGTRFSKNRRFRFRTSFWMDFSAFWPHFRPQNAPKWAPGPSREKSRLLVPIFSILGSISGPIWPPWGAIFRQKSTTSIEETHFLALRDAPGSIFGFFMVFLPIWDRFWRVRA